MNTINSESRPKKAWLAGAVIASIIGGAATVAFAAWWFADVGGHCGVVRFYEQAFGVFVVGGWLAGTAGGLLVAFLGGRRSAKAVVAGSIIAILTNLAAVTVCAKVVYGVRAADNTLKNTDELLAQLSGNDLDARKLSAHALGERRAVEALAPLCAIMDSAGEDVNLRHNATVALGRICASPRRDGVDVDRTLASLTGALKGRDEYLPDSICKALGDIGDSRAIAPLAEYLGDGSRPVHAREEAARALGRIGGQEARTALEKALPDAADESLARTIRSAIEGTRRLHSSEPDGGSQER
jgi:hypothetical protein